jgi:hypothetical protein
MLAWWLILFTLGVMSFIDTFFGVGDTFRQVTAAVFILAALGLLSRISRKVRQGEKEKLIDRIAHLEQELLTARMATHRAEAVPGVSNKATVEM